jgi:hypothetical protein
MPRNISFSLTTPQFIDGTKDVTRRMGWKFLRAGDVLCVVEKGQGLGKGGKVKRLGMIRVIDARREKLNLMCADLSYGEAECVREGFPPPGEYSDPTQFVHWFAEGHRCLPSSIITRIEFVRLP